jgi:hypothetical protein
MTDLNKRLIAGILGVVLAFGIVACDEADPSITTAPESPGTTEPVGS